MITALAAAAATWAAGSALAAGAWSLLKAPSRQARSTRNDHGLAA